MNCQRPFIGSSILGNFKATQLRYEKFDLFIGTNVVMIAVRHMYTLKNSFYQEWWLNFTNSSGFALIRDSLLYASDIFHSRYGSKFQKLQILKREEINR